MTAVGFVVAVSLLVVMSVVRGAPGWRRRGRRGTLELAPACRAAAHAGLCGPGAAQGHRPAHVSSAHIWWFVSDLHLGAGPDHRGTAAALVEFLGVVADTRPETGRSIVLLGDSFDLPTDDGATAALSAIARRHPEVFAALARARSVGLDIEVVCGNHDTALARPAVRKILEHLLSVGVTGRPPPAGGAVHVHPWWLHEPHVFHAEHGHRHHDVHRLPTLLEQSVSSPPAQSLPDGLVRDGRRRTDPAAGRRDASGPWRPRAGSRGRSRRHTWHWSTRRHHAPRSPSPPLAPWCASRAFALCPPRWA